MEYHPDKNQDKAKFSDDAFKKIREAYDVLSNPKLKSKYDKKGQLNQKYLDFVKKSKNTLDKNATEYAFSELIKGRYPNCKDKRDLNDKKSKKLDVSKLELHINNFKQF